MVIIDENDIGKSEKTLLMDLIYESNEFRIPDHFYTHGIPMALDQRPDLDKDQNTFIYITVDKKYEDVSYHGKRGVMYRRHNLSELVDNTPIQIEFTDWPVMLSELMETQINPQLDYPLGPKDYIDYEINDENVQQLNILPNRRSLFWMGGTKINVVPPSSEFFDLVPNPFITGFVAYQP